MIFIVTDAYLGKNGANSLFPKVQTYTHRERERDNIYYTERDNIYYTERDNIYSTERDNIYYTERNNLHYTFITHAKHSLIQHLRTEHIYFPHTHTLSITYTIFLLHAHSFSYTHSLSLTHTLFLLHALSFSYTYTLSLKHTLFLLHTHSFSYTHSLSLTHTLSFPFYLHQDILNHPRVGSIHFNPVAATILQKALSRIVTGEGQKRHVSNEDMKQLASTSGGKSSLVVMFVCVCVCFVCV